MILINKIIAQETTPLAITPLGEYAGVYLAHLGKYYFYFKIVFIVFLFILNIYFLYCSDKSLDIYIDSKQSIINRLNAIFKEYSTLIVGIGSVYAATLNSSTAKSQKEREELKVSTDQTMSRCQELKSEEYGLLSRLSLLSKKVADVDMKVDQAKLNSVENEAAAKEVSKCTAIMHETWEKFRKSNDENEKVLLDIKLTEQSLILKRLTTSIYEKNSKNKELVDDINQILTDSSISVDIKEGEPTHIKDDDIKKSNIFNIDNFEEWFNNLTVLQQISFSLLLTHGVVLSALTNIIFIHYGNIIINKFNLETRYPKLKRYIEYRNKFTQFYFLNSCFIIFIVCLTYISFAIVQLAY